MPSPGFPRSLRALVGAGLCASLLFGAAACGGDDDGDTQTIESEDGEITVSGDGDGGSGVITGPDGEETEFSVGDKAELPAGWPDEFQLPDGAEIHTSTAADGGDTLSVVAMVDGDVTDVYEHFKGVFEGEGIELLTDTLSDLGDQTMASLSGEDDGVMWSAVVMADAADSGQAQMSLSVVESE